jgi:hypothetical protein
MVSEVESILNEIRANVRSAQAEAAGRGLDAPDAPDETPADDSLVPSSNGNSAANKSLARISANLTTTARAWDRLPPVFSNRSGTTARLELWIKARFKSLANWFTWEQVNFNAAVHHALSETLESLSAQEQQLRALKGELRRTAEDRRIELDRSERALQALRDSLEAQTAESRRQVAVIETHNKQTNAALEEIRTRFTDLAELGVQLSAAAALMENQLAAQGEANARLTHEIADVEMRVSQRVADVDARILQQSEDVDARISRQSEETDQRLAAQATQAAAQVAEINDRIAAEGTDVRARIANESASVGDQLSAHATELNRHLSELAAEVSSRLSGLAIEISEVSNGLREEQKVCFKQLSLETSEASVREDRGRRSIEARLGKLEKRGAGRK